MFTSLRHYKQLFYQTHHPEAIACSLKSVTILDVQHGRGTDFFKGGQMICHTHLEEHRNIQIYIRFDLFCCIAQFKNKRPIENGQHFSVTHLDVTGERTISYKYYIQGIKYRRIRNSDIKLLLKVSYSDPIKPNLNVTIYLNHFGIFLKLYFQCLYKFFPLQSCHSFTKLLTL